MNVFEKKNTHYFNHKKNGHIKNVIYLLSSRGNKLSIFDIRDNLVKEFEKDCYSFSSEVDIYILIENSSVHHEVFIEELCLQGLV